MLIDKGADIFMADKNGVTPMMQAATIGNIDAMKYLYEKASETGRAAEILEP